MADGGLLLRIQRNKISLKEQQFRVKSSKFCCIKICSYGSIEKFYFFIFFLFYSLQFHCSYGGIDKKWSYTYGGFDKNQNVTIFKYNSKASFKEAFLQLWRFR